MIFQYTWEKVLSGEKTQTRRLVKSNERLLNTSDGKKWVDQEFVHHDRQKYIVGVTYSVQPARTHPTLIYHPEHPCYGIDIIDPGDDHYQMAKSGEWNYRGQGYIQARIRITDIRREDVRNISEADAIAEGFATPLDFLATWVSMHDKPARYFVDKFIEFKDDFDEVNGVRSAGFRVMVPSPDKDQYYYNAPDYLKARRPAERYDAWALTFERMI